MKKKMKKMKKMAWLVASVAMLLVMMMIMITSQARVVDSRAIPVIPQRPEDRYSYRAEHAPTSAMILDDRRRDAIAPFSDPLDVMVLNTPSSESSEYVKKIKSMLEPSQSRVEWLDSSIEEDRLLLGYMFKYCARLFEKMGAFRDCAVQCHPKVDCDTQAARNCQDVKDQYAAFVKCSDKERQFCHKFGEFNGEKFPQFRRVARQKEMSELQKVEDVASYCGDLFQWRGVRLSCLRECTIYKWKSKEPTEFYRWKAAHRMRIPLSNSAGKDPTVDVSKSQRTIASCEDMASEYCRFLPKDYFRECYERQKMSCMDKMDAMNDVLPPRTRNVLNR